MNKPLKLLILTSLIFLSNCAKKQVVKEDIIDEIVPIVTISPYYPKEAAINKIEGEATVEFIVNIKGTVDNPRVINSIPKKIFDQAAIDAVSKFKFSPKRINHEPVESVMTQTFYFKLSKDN